MDAINSQINKAKMLPELQAVIQKFQKKTLLPTITLKAVRGEATVFSSKLGGAPYLPRGFTYPVSENPTSKGLPLRLLAQLNFAELPSLPDFPEQGILQFYIEADDLYGADFDAPTEQLGFRVIYHETVEIDASKLQEPPDIDTTQADMLPFEGEFILSAKQEEMPMSTTDFRFDQAFMTAYCEQFPTAAKRIWDLDGQHRDMIWDSFDATGHRIGGYPFFTQQDPRSYNQRISDYTVLLLQIDSDGSGDDEILWGDCGVAGFFITPEQLKKRDFSKVLYNWDCC